MVHPFSDADELAAALRDRPRPDGRAPVIAMIPLP